MLPQNPSVLEHRKYSSNKAVSNMAFFAVFSQEYHLNPSDLAELMMILKKTVNAGVKHSNCGTTESLNQFNKFSDEFEVLANKMGFTDIEWPGFFPTAKFGSYTIHSWPTGE